MKKVIVMCNSDPFNDPRPNRMINWLKDEYRVTVMGAMNKRMVGVESINLWGQIPLEPPPNSPAEDVAFTSVSELDVETPPLERGPLRRFAAALLPGPVKYGIWKTIIFIVNLKPRFAIARKKGLIRGAAFFFLPERLRTALRMQYERMRLMRQQQVLSKPVAPKTMEDIVWEPLGHARQIMAEHAEIKYDLVITHDISLMPLASGIARGSDAPILLDAREYYTRNFEDQEEWRKTIKPVNQYLCNQYLKICDKVITVSDGLAQEYKREFEIDPEVVMSMPSPRDLMPSQIIGDSIRIIHHGYASASRRMEVMIEMMDHVDKRFTLDLMLVVGRDVYWDKIVKMAEERKNVRIIPPVPFDEIVPFTNQYDIGLFLVPPTNFNLTYTLPNKFFEFIQARLAVAIGPSIEMKKIVEQYGCGIVADDFEPKSLAAMLNALTVEKLMYYKLQSHKAAAVLNADTAGARVKSIVREVIHNAVEQREKGSKMETGINLASYGSA